MKRLERDMRRLLLVILVEVAAVLSIVGVFSARIMSTNARSAELDLEVAKLQPVVKRIEFYDNATSELQPKVDLLNNAKAHTMRWYHMLHTLSVTIPQNTWLTRIAAAPAPPDANEITVNLNGISADQNLIGETMLRLNSYPGFARVDLHFTQKTMVGARGAIEFEVGAGLKLGEKAVAKGNDKPNDRGNS